MSPLKDVVRAVKNGDTEFTGALAGFPQAENGLNACAALVREGLIDVILDLIQQAPFKSVEEIFPRISVASSSKPHVRLLPWMWTQTLCSWTASNSDVLAAARMKIARRLRPMVECMTNLDQQEYFKDGDIWGHSLPFFAGIISHLIDGAPTQKVLLENDSSDTILKFLIQCTFIHMYRPDLKEKLDLQFQEFPRSIPRSTHPLRALQGAAISALLDYSDPLKNAELSSEEYKQRLLRLASLPATPDHPDETERTAHFAQRIFESMTKDGIATPFYRYNLLKCFKSLLDGGVGSIVFGEDTPGKIIETGFQIICAFTQRGGVGMSELLHALRFTCEGIETLIHPPGRLDGDTAALLVDKGLFELGIKIVTVLDTPLSAGRVLFQCGVTLTEQGLILPITTAASVSSKVVAAIRRKLPSIEQDCRACIPKLKHELSKMEIEGLVPRLTDLISQAQEDDDNFGSDYTVVIVETNGSAIEQTTITPLHASEDNDIHQDHETGVATTDTDSDVPSQSPLTFRCSACRAVFPTVDEWRCGRCTVTPYCSERCQRRG